MVWTKTPVIERTRTHYARSEGASVIVQIEDPLEVDLELPASYARDLLADVRRAIAEGAGIWDGEQIALDVPFRLQLTSSQFKQLAEQLAKLTEDGQ